MEQQEKNNSPIHPSGGIPAFASIALFLVGFYILMPLFGIILSSIPVLKEWRMGAFFIGGSYVAERIYCNLPDDAIS